jgi:quercetin dioxygenase-like cupin family protein
MSDGRTPVLREFLDLTQRCIAARVGHDSAAGAAMRKVGAALAKPAQTRPKPAPLLLPACHHLPAALASVAGEVDDLTRLADAVRRLAPDLAWRHRASSDAAFTAGHANAYVVGPEADALEQRDDVRIGLSLMAPATTYPDHQHPPEEVYIVLSGGEWRQRADPWITPGRGGIVYNPPDIVHAMRAGPEPLLAIWCLPT